jgi:hypothetical protein
MTKNQWCLRAVSVDYLAAPIRNQLFFLYLLNELGSIGANHEFYKLTHIFKGHFKVMNISIDNTINPKPDEDL